MSWVYATPGSTRLSYTRDKTPNEKFRFLAATTGYRFIAQFGNPPNSSALSITGGVGEVTLPFEYFVGKQQLAVFLIDPVTGFKTPIVNEDEYNAAVTAVDVNTALTAAGAYVYREITKNQIEVNQTTPAGNPMTTEIIEVWVPHTSIPGISQDRIVVDNQTDDVAIQLKGANDGIEFVSPGGIVYLLTVADGGNLLVRPK